MLFKKVLPDSIKKKKRMDLRTAHGVHIFCASAVEKPVSRLSLVMSVAIKTQMSSNLVKLNRNKTELIVVALKAVLPKIGDLLTDIVGRHILLSPEVHNLGDNLSFTLPFQAHIHEMSPDEHL